jgi:hypothetical protein
MARQTFRPAHVRRAPAAYVQRQEVVMTLRQVLLAVLIFLLASTSYAGDVQKALFKNDGEGFTRVKDNPELQALLKTSPPLDFFETAALGSTEDVKRQLDRDPSLISARTKWGWTALHMAAFGGNVANARLLIERGANIEDRAKTKFRNTPLQVALLTGEYDTAKLLLDHGADALVRQSAGFTPMHEAASLGRTDLIQLLLDHGAELNSRSDSGRTPLSEAARGKHADTVAFLKTKGAVEDYKDKE